MFERYIVQNNDNLDYVAKKYNTTNKILRDLNNLSFNDYVENDMELIVPTKTQDYYNYYVVEKGDNLYSIARKYNVNPKLLAVLNGVKDDEYIYPNQQLLVPKEGYSYYITAEGDTINEVVKAFGITMDKFLNENETIYLMQDQLLVNKKAS